MPKDQQTKNIFTYVFQNIPILSLVDIILEYSKKEDPLIVWKRNALLTYVQLL